ncbi:MAG: molybdopterin-binding protein, partial [Comamonas sp.]
MKIFKAPTLSGVDADGAVREARALIASKLDQPARRAFLQRSFTLGGLSLLTGCSISDDAHVEAALGKISRFNDKVQALI